MVDWYLNRALTNFRSEVNLAYPDRDKASDGTIGDAAHQATTSDHNPDPDGSVDAWDMDVQLNGRAAPYTVDVEALKAVFEAHESSRYWIHDRQIATRSTGWRRDPYTGASAHLEHVHWNTREAYESSSKPWGVEVFTDADRKLLTVVAWRMNALYGGKPAVPAEAPLVAGEPNGVDQDLTAILAAVKAPAPVDMPALLALLRPELEAAAERAVRKVLGALDAA